jgi:hypothetical protein
MGNLKMLLAAEPEWGVEPSLAYPPTPPTILHLVGELPSPHTTPACHLAIAPPEDDWGAAGRAVFACLFFGIKEPR